LVGVAAAGDVVDGDAAPAGQVVQGDQLAGLERGGDESGPMRDQDLESGGRVQHGLGDREAVGAGGRVSDEHAIEPGLLVGLGEFTDPVGVDPRVLREPLGLGSGLVADEADDLCGHDCSPVREATAIGGGTGGWDGVWSGQVVGFSYGSRPMAA
jgi:hypothetical protein